jgi:hypothetical protein
MKCSKIEQSSKTKFKKPTNCPRSEQHFFIKTPFVNDFQEADKGKAENKKIISIFSIF